MAADWLQATTGVYSWPAQYHCKSEKRLVMHTVLTALHSSFVVHCHAPEPACSLFKKGGGPGVNGMKSELITSCKFTLHCS